MYNTVRKDKFDDGKWFFFTLLFIFFDYGRPQDIVPIGFLRPALLVSLPLIFFVIKYKAIETSKSNQTRMIWYFIALLAMYVPFAVNNHNAYYTFYTMLMYMPFILSVIVCVNSMQRLQTFMKLYIALMVYVALYSFFHAGMGSGNYFRDENDVSLYINMVIPFSYFLFLIEKNKKLKLFYVASFVIGVMTVVVSFSRGGFVGLIAVFFVIWLVSPRKLLTIFFIAVMGVSVLLLSGDKYLNEMSTVTDTKESTANARLMSWASAWDMFLDNPLGVGGNNFQVRFSEYQDDRFSRGMYGRVAHSLWFTLIPELGIFGIILYFRLFKYNIKDILRIKTKEKTDNPDLIYLNAMSIAFIASLAGFFSSATFISVLYYPHYWYLIAIIVATVRISDSVKAANIEAKNSHLEKT